MGSDTQTERHAERPAEDKEITDQELLEYFAPEEQLPTSRGPYNNELSVILIHIEEIIDCLMSLIPSVCGITAANLTVGTMSIDTESLDKMMIYEMGSFAWLIDEQFRGLNFDISKRLAASLTWRRSRLRQFPGPPNSKRYSRK